MESGKKEEPTPTTLTDRITAGLKALAIRIGKGIGCMAISAAVGGYLGVAACTAAGVKQGEGATVGVGKMIDSASKSMLGRALVGPISSTMGKITGGIIGFIVGTVVVAPVLSAIALVGSAAWGITRGFDTITTLWGNTCNVLMRAATGEQLSAEGVAMFLTGSLPDEAAAPRTLFGRIIDFFSDSWDLITNKGVTLDQKIKSAQQARENREFREHAARLGESSDPAAQKELEKLALQGGQGIGGVDDLDPYRYQTTPQATVKNTTPKTETPDEFKRRVEEHANNKTPLYKEYENWFAEQTTLGLKSFEDWLKIHEKKDSVKPAATSYAEMLRDVFKTGFSKSPHSTKEKSTSENADKITTPLYSSRRHTNDEQETPNHEQTTPRRKK